MAKKIYCYLRWMMVLAFGVVNLWALGGLAPNPLTFTAGGGSNPTTLKSNSQSPYRRVPTPVITNAYSTSGQPQYETISCSDPLATVYYTLDGTVPTQSSSVATPGLMIPLPATTSDPSTFVPIRAKVFRKYWDSSATESLSFQPYIPQTLGSAPPFNSTTDGSSKTVTLTFKRPVRTVTARASGTAVESGYVGSTLVTTGPPIEFFGYYFGGGNPVDTGQSTRSSVGSVDVTNQMTLSSDHLHMTFTVSATNPNGVATLNEKVFNLLPVGGMGVIFNVVNDSVPVVNELDEQYSGLSTTTTGQGDDVGILFVNPAQDASGNTIAPANLVIKGDPAGNLRQVFWPASANAKFIIKDYQGNVMTSGFTVSNQQDAVYTIVATSAEVDLSDAVISLQPYTGGGNYGVVAQVQLVMNPGEINVDADRNGVIVMAKETPSGQDGNGNSVDTTSQTQPFRFWVNDGEDGYSTISGETTVQEDKDPSTGTPNWQMDQVTCPRDLENFARFWLYTKGLNTAISAGHIIVGLEWHSNTGDATTGWGTNDGAPSINIYAAAPKHGSSTVTGGTDYLTDADTATDQANSTYGVPLGTVSKGAPFYFDPSTFSGLTDANPKTYFLFEAAARGTGRLVITFNTLSGSTYTKIGEVGAVYMDLKETQELYERWTVGDGPAPSYLTAGGGGAPASTAVISSDRLPSGVTGLQYSSSQTGLSVPGDSTGNDYILFVHGWNMPPWEKDAFAATAFKRLYWQGYKGKFGTFEWPTTYSAAGILGYLQDVTIYDDGEYTAWKSALPLEGLLSQLHGNYGGNVFVLAHSMGNVVTGEALSIAGQSGAGQLVNTYVATQAAVPGHCFDPTLTGSDLLNFSPSFSSEYGPDTPNVYNNWMMLTSLGVGSKVNFYNTNDYALSANIWQLDQIAKPDIRSQVYYYASSDLTTVSDLFKKSTYPDIPTAELIISTHTGIFPTALHLATTSAIQNQYEIMAYDSEPRSKALGGVSDAAGFAQQNAQSLWPPDPYETDPSKFYSDPQWHSAEFLFTNSDQEYYWQAIMFNFGLTPISLPPKP